MRSIITLAFALILSAPALSQEGRMTGGTFLELEAAAVDPNGSPLVTLYLMATLDSLGIANAVLEENERAPLYCLPARDTLSAADMRTIVGLLRCRHGCLPLHVRGRSSRISRLCATVIEAGERPQGGPPLLVSSAVVDFDQTTAVKRRLDSFEHRERIDGVVER